MQRPAASLERPLSPSPGRQTQQGPALLPRGFAPGQRALTRWALEGHSFNIVREQRAAFQPWKTLPVTA